MAGKEIEWRDRNCTKQLPHPSVKHPTGFSKRPTRPCRETLSEDGEQKAVVTPPLFISSNLSNFLFCVIFLFVGFSFATVHSSGIFCVSFVSSLGLSFAGFFFTLFGLANLLQRDV